MRGRNRAEGNRRAFEVLVRPHLRMLYRTALRMTGDGQAAEDLVQETCLKAYSAFERFEAGTNFKAWLLRILTNGFIDTHRRASRSIPVDDPIDVDALEVGGSPSLEVHILYRDFRAEAFRAMAGLPPEIRAVVSLSLLESFSYQEIAEVMGIPIGTVRSRLSRGRRQLQRRLKDFLPDGAVAERTSLSQEETGG